MAIKLLSALAAHRSSTEPVGGLDPKTLRFVIEYPTRVDADAEAERIRGVIGVAELQFFPLFEAPGADSRFGEFYVLQLPGLERTVDNPTLFAMAHELQARLGAVTVEPDLGSEFYQEPTPADPAPESVIGDVFHGTCFVAGDPPPEHSWALDRAGVLGAFAAGTARGAGIRIGQPDTGVTTHIELSDVDIADGYNILTGKPDPTDPMSGNGNPGHGTGTASVMTSGPGGVVGGSAPAATLVPIRCIESVILTFNGSAVAKAIDYARLRGCHIVTMSLGGTPSRAVQSAIEQAIASHMIVLAAAGNCVRLVVYPARYDNVIAVAGSNVGDAPWRGSCRGPAVDITAPGEKVWKAVAGPSGTDIGGGQGTSFAVAITAGVAALWLSHHGRQHVIDTALRRRMSVQELFREALTASARTPAGWRTDDFGPGIVDAAALLGVSIDGPIAPAPEGAPGDGAVDTIELLGDAWGAAEAGRLADVAARPQFRLELSSVVFEQVRVGADRSPEAGAEASGIRQAVSPQLEAALDGRAPALRSRTDFASAAPSLRAESLASKDPAVLIAGRAGLLESAGDPTPEAARESLRTDTDAPLSALAEQFGRVRANISATKRAALASRHDQLLRHGEAVLQHLRDGESIPGDLDSQTALEALVQLTGRPAVRLGDDGVDPDDPLLGDWQGAVILHRTFATLQRSVGRINTEAGSHVGTGFVVGNGIIMTNRHVLEAIAAPTPSRQNPSGWVLTGRPVVNFSPSGMAAAQTFRITDVVFSGPDPIDGRINLAHLDLALLRVEPVNAAGTVLPQRLALSEQAVAVGAAKVFVVGYPAMPTRLPTDEQGKRRMDVVRRLQEIYDMKYGVRYLSPGLVMTPAQSVPDSPKHWVFTHDATSLGGNSGSCVMSFDHNLDVTGLHFAGDWLRANFAHAIDEVGDLIAEFLA